MAPWVGSFWKRSREWWVKSFLLSFFGCVGDEKFFFFFLGGDFGKMICLVMACWLLRFAASCTSKALRNDKSKAWTWQFSIPQEEKVKELGEAFLEGRPWAQGLSLRGSFALDDKHRHLLSCWDP